MSQGRAEVVEAAARAGVAPTTLYERMRRHQCSLAEAEAMGRLKRPAGSRKHRRAWDRRKSHDRMVELVGERVRLVLDYPRPHRAAGVVVAAPAPVELGRHRGPSGVIVMWHRVLVVHVEGEDAPRPIAFERVIRGVR